MPLSPDPLPPGRNAAVTRRTTLTLLAAFAAVAFAVRVGVAVHFKAWQSPGAMEHKSIAVSLAHGDGFYFGDWNYWGPTSVQSPPFPFLLAGLFKAFGAVTSDAGGHGVLIAARAERAYRVVLVINALAGAALVYLTYAAARTVGASPTAALIAAGLVAVWPTQVYSARFVQAVSIITAGLMAMVVLYYRAVRTGSAGAWTAFAAVAAVSALTEPVLLPALGLSGILVLLARPLTAGQRLRNGAILAFAGVAVIGPWAARNYVVHGKLIPVKGSFWVNVWKGNNDFASGTDRPKMTAAQAAKYRHQIKGGGDDFDDSLRQYDLLDLTQKGHLSNHPEAYREELFKQYVVDWIKTHKVRYAQLCGIRLLKTLTVDWDNPKSLYLSYPLARAAVDLLALAGLVVAWRQRWSLLFPAMVAGVALASYTMTVTAARFAFPFEPLQLILGGGAIAAVLEWASARAGLRRPASPTAGPTTSPTAEPAAGRGFEPKLSMAHSH